MFFFRKILFPFIIVWWVFKFFRFTATHKRRVVLSEPLCGHPVSLEKARDLISAYVCECGKEWKIPLDTEILEAVRGRESEYGEPIWALDGSRFWTAFRPSDGAVLARSDLITDSMEGARCRVYLIKHEYI